MELQIDDAILTRYSYHDLFIFVLGYLKHKNINNFQIEDSSF